MRIGQRVSWGLIAAAMTTTAFAAPDCPGQLVALDLNAEATAAVAHWQPVYHHGRFLLELDPEVPPLLLGARRLQQTFGNLIVNAFDAGASLVTIRTASLSVTDALVAPGGRVPSGTYVALTVADDGSGIALEHLPRLFVPGFTTKGLLGTGLGLSSVRSFADDSGGHVQLESRWGEGTAVTLYFPGP